MNTCGRLLSCNVSFLSLSRERHAHTHLLCVTLRNQSNWQYLIYFQSISVPGGGGLWFSRVPTLKNIPPKCWSTLPHCLSLHQKCFYFINHLLTSRTTRGFARALYFLFVGELTNGHTNQSVTVLLCAPLIVTTKPNTKIEYWHVKLKGLYWIWYYCLQTQQNTWSSFAVFWARGGSRSLFVWVYFIYAKDCTGVWSPFLLH